MFFLDFLAGDGRNDINMRKILLVFLLFTAIILPDIFCSELTSNEEFSLTLQDAIGIAFKNNKDIQISEQDISFAKAGIMSARSQFLPNVDANYSYTHNEAVSPVVVQGTKKDMGLFAGYKNDNLLGIGVTQTIYDGGANIAGFRQAQLNFEASNQTLRVKKLDVEFETKRLYYGLLLAYETQRIAQDLVGQAKTHYEDVKTKFGQGTSSKFDVLQSSVQVSKLMPQLISAVNDIRLVMADLNKQLGIKIQAETKAKDKLVYSLIEIKEDDFLRQAYLTAPEMTVKSLGIDINKWAINIAKAGYRPQLTADLNYFYRSNNWNNMFNSKHNNWNAGIAMSVPIFDGFSSKAKVDEAKARYTQANLDKANLIDQIAVNIRQACLDLKEAQTIIDSQKDNVEEAKEALRIANVGYDNGVNTNLDVLDAQVSLAQVEQNLAQGIYDYLLAKAFLDRTIGISFIQEAKNEEKR